MPNWVPHLKMEGIGSLKYVLQKDDFMGKIDAYLSGWFTRNTKNFVRYRWSTSSDLFCATWKLNNFTKISGGLGSEDEKNKYVYHCQLGKTFVMAQIRGYWCHMQTILPESYRHWFFQARSHGADTQLPGVLRAFSNIDARGKMMKECRQELSRLHKRITIT